MGDAELGVRWLLAHYSGGRTGRKRGDDQPKATESDFFVIAVIKGGEIAGRWIWAWSKIGKLLSTEAAGWGTGLRRENDREGRRNDALVNNWKLERGHSSSLLKKKSLWQRERTSRRPALL